MYSILKLHCQLIQLPREVLKTVEINYSKPKIYTDT